MSKTNFLLEARQVEGTSGFDVKIKLEGTKENLLFLLSTIYNKEPKVKNLLKASIEAHEAFEQFIKD